MRILFVDDVVENRQLFSLAFGMEGHTTRLAADGMEAVQAVSDELFDAIVMDVGMPRMDGWEATRRIRKMPQGATVPIYMFTGFSGDNDLDEAHKAGATGLLRKPLAPHRLLMHITDNRPM